MLENTTYSKPNCEVTLKQREISMALLSLMWFCVFAGLRIIF